MNLTRLKIKLMMSLNNNSLSYQRAILNYYLLLLTIEQMKLRESFINIEF